MKPAYLIVILLLLALPGVAQNWDSYLISVKGDTINCLDKKKMKQGKWVIRTEALRGEPGY